MRNVETNFPNWERRYATLTFLTMKVHRKWFSTTKENKSIRSLLESSLCSAHEYTTSVASFFEIILVMRLRAKIKNLKMRKPTYSEFCDRFYVHSNFFSFTRHEFLENFLFRLRHDFFNSNKNYLSNIKRKFEKTLWLKTYRKYISIKWKVLGNAE